MRYWEEIVEPPVILPSILGAPKIPRNQPQMPGWEALSANRVCGYSP